MLFPDVVNFKQFYSSAFGDAVRVLLEKKIHEFWPQPSRDTTLAIGFPTPYLNAQATATSPIVVCMPATQGAVYWPPASPNCVFLGNDAQLPLKESSVNRVLLIHCIEYTEQLSWLMEEIIRVLVPGGRVIAITPNRLGLWARSARSPFGYGRPFSQIQLRELFTSHDFTVLRTHCALFAPPFYWRWLWGIASSLESLGKYCLRPLGGVLILEAEKQIYAAIRQPVVVRKHYKPVSATPFRA